MSEKPTPTVESSPKSSRRGRAAWYGGAVLIIVGLAFIVENLHLPFIKEGNWWAIFLLIPMVAILDDIYRLYTSSAERKTGAIASKVAGLVVIGIIMIVFLFGVNLGIYWPLVLIAAGLAFLLAAIIR